MGGPQLLPTNPISRIYLVDDFIASTGSAAQTGTLNWQASNTGAGATPTILMPPDNAHPGILNLSTGTTATGKSGIFLSPSITTNSMKPYAGQFAMTWYLQVPILSNGTDRFAFRFGFGDSITADFANGIYFEYDDSASANWRVKTAAASTRTVVDSGVAVASGTWTKFQIFTNNAAVSFSYSINGSTVGTISSNMPTLDVSPIAFIIKALGTTARNVYIDYFVLDYKLAATR